MFSGFTVRYRIMWSFLRDQITDIWFWTSRRNRDTNHWPSHAAGLCFQPRPACSKTDGKTLCPYTLYLSCYCPCSHFYIFYGTSNVFLLLFFHKQHEWCSSWMLNFWFSCLGGTEVGKAIKGDIQGNIPDRQFTWFIRSFWLPLPPKLWAVQREDEEGALFWRHCGAPSK